MAKLMAPNIRIDWYPDGHFEDALNPTLAELNSGYNLSPAIVTGFTLDFTDSETVSRANIFEEFSHDTITHFSYEASLQFFLAPRRHRIYDFGKTDTENEAAYRKAEELFYHNNHTTGYFVKRIGYKWNVDYSAGQKIDIFHVQSTYPKLTVEDNRPILLEVPFLPLGFAASRAYAGVIRYEWLGERHNSESVMIVDGNEIARNLYPNPSFEYSVGGFSGNMRRKLSDEWADAGYRSMKAWSNYDIRDGTGYGNIVGMNGTQETHPIVERGKTYTIYVTVRKDRTYGKHIGYLADVMQGGGSHSRSPDEPGVYRLRLVTTVPELGAWYYLRLVHGGVVDDPPVWWDNLAIFEGDVELDYFDGDSIYND